MSKLHSDSPRKAYNRKAQTVEAPTVTLDAVSSGDHRVNDKLASGCGYGKFVIVTGLINSAAPAVTHAAMYMKQGFEPANPWCPLSAEAGLSRITPSAYTLAPTGVRNTDFKRLVSAGDSINALGIPTVDVADLADVGHPINQYHISGKNRYTFVIGKDETDADFNNWTYTLYMATGLAPASPWVDFAATPTPITPTGTPMAASGTLRSDRARKAYNAKVTSLGFTVVSDADLSSASAGINVYGKQTSATVISVNDLENPTSFKIYTATDFYPTDDWLNLDGISAAVTPS